MGCARIIEVLYQAESIHYQNEKKLDVGYQALDWNYYTGSQFLLQAGITVQNNTVYLSGASYRHFAF